MRVLVENLGVLRQAEFELGDLTIICGKNNTGKTYATYALFGFLAGWQDSLDVKIPGRRILALLNDGVTRIDVAAYAAKATELLARGCREYSQQLSRVLVSKPAHFKSSTFRLELPPDTAPEVTNAAFDRKIRSNRAELFSLVKEKGDSHPCGIIAG